MRIRYLSDLHTEFYNIVSLNRLLMRIPSGPTEVCILAGDIGNINKSKKNYDITMRYLSKNFERVFVISGNHEYYTNDTITIEQTNEKMASYFSESGFTNVEWLNNQISYYKDYAFIGTTLWSHVPPGTPPINDTTYIYQMTVEKQNAINDESKAWLRSQIPVMQSNTEKGIKNIIISHHMPSEQFIAPKYRGSNINPWFYCNMEKFIERNGKNIYCWIYGHTHTPSKNTLYGVPMLCNPIGYPGENSNIQFAETFST